MVRIRPVGLDDAAELEALYRENRDYLAPFHPDRAERFFTVDGQRERIAGAREEAARGRAFQFVIVDDDRIAGAISLENVVRGAAQAASVGYWVSEAQTGRGLATAAVGLVVGHAFGVLDLHRLDAGTLVENVASQRVLERNRFERVGVARRYLHIAGQWRDHVLFQRTRE